MSKLRFLLLGAVALLPTMGSAIDLCERCWEIGGDALYWRPCGEYQYGVALAAEPNRAIDLGIRAGYDWGFRLGGATYTHDCCHLFFLDWYYLKTSDATTTRPDATIFFPLPAVFGPTATYPASLKTRYNRVNVRAGRYVSSHCKSLGYVFGGVRYVDIERKQQAALVPDEPGTGTQFREKSQFEGAAFEVGYGANVTEPCGFSLIGHVSGLMGIGSRTASQRLTIVDEQEVNAIDYLHPGSSACIVGAELRLGLQWRYECGCTWLTLEAGYEHHHYWDALRLMSPVLNQNDPQVRSTELVDASFAGPFFGASLRF